MSLHRRHSFRPVLDQLEDLTLPGPSVEFLGLLAVGSELAFLRGSTEEIAITDGTGEADDRSASPLIASAEPPIANRGLSQYVHK